MLGLVLVAPGVALAQDNGGGRRAGGGRGSVIDAMKDPLGLTDDQVAKMKPIEEEMRGEMQKLRDEMRGGDNGPPDWQAMMEKIKPLRDKMAERIKALLTDEQKPKFDDFMKNEDQRRMQRMGAGGPGGPGFGRGPSDKELADRAEKELTLGPDEKAAVMPLVKKVLEAKTNARQAAEKRREDLKAFLKNVPGTTDGQREEIAQKLKELKSAAEAETAKVKAAQDALRELLTPENEARLITLGVLEG